MYSSCISDDYAQQLFERFCKREQHAANELIAIYGNKLFKFINGCYIYDYNEASDCLQEIWTKLIKDYCGKPLPSNLWSIMCRLAKNQAIDTYRARTRQKRNPEEIVEYQEESHQSNFIEDNHPNPEKVLELLEEAEYDASRLKMFKAAIMQLPDKQRIALILKMKGYNLSEIAKITSEKEEAIKSQIRLAKAKLQYILRQEINQAKNRRKIS